MFQIQAEKLVESEQQDQMQSRTKQRVGSRIVKLTAFKQQIAMLYKAGNARMANEVMTYCSR
jgi:hypothetical protein